MNRWTLAVFALVVGACAPGGRDCGDRFCDTRFETAGNCPADCGGSSCGDRFCDVGENCSVCASDCGACTGCGDGLCQTTAGETCSTCPGDCGACGAQADPYETCGGGTTCSLTRDTCTAIMNGTVTRSMCTTSCSSDGDCDFDMFGAAGDCVSYPGSGGTCFHRCLDSGDCYPGFACYVPTGSTGALGNVCLPDAGPPGPTVSPYRRCSTSADCIGGLQCINYNVSGASENLCSASPCANDDDCPFDSRGGRGACLFLGGVSSCWERCNFRADCINTVDFDCSNSAGGTPLSVMVCVPR